MPDLQKTVEILFYGDNQVSKTVATIGRDVENFGSKMQGVTQPLADVTTSILKLEAALAALAVAGIGAVINETGKFQDSFNEISTLIDAPAASIDAFRQDILDYSRDSTASLDSISEATYQAISAGTEWDEALKDLSQTEKLATATKGDLTDSTQLIAQTLNAYGRSVIDAGTASDLYFTLIKSGVTRIDELAASMGKVTPIAAQLGIPLETINAALVSLTKSGLNTSEAVTSLSALLSSFLKPTGEVNKLLGESSDLWSANAIKTKGFEVALKDALQAVDFNEEAIARLTGRKEALISALTLGIDQSGFFAEALDDMADAAGATETAFAKMADGFADTNQRLANNLKATLIEVGTPLLDDYRGIIDGLIDIFQSVSFSFNAGAFNPVIDQIEKLSLSLQNYLKDLAAVIPEALEGIDWTGLTQSVDSLVKSARDLFEGFFGGVDLTTVQGMEVAVQKVVDAITALNNITTGILEALRPFAVALSDIIDTMANSDQNTQKLTGSLLGFGTAMNSVFGAVENLGGAISALGYSLAALNFTKTIGALGQLGGAASGLLVTLGKLSAAAGAFAVGYYIGDRFLADIPIIKEFSTVVADAVLGVQGLSDEQIKNKEESADFTKALGDAHVNMVRLAEAIEGTPDLLSFEVDMNLQSFFGGIDDIEKTLNEKVPDEKTIEVKSELDKTSLQQTKNDVITVFGAEGEVEQIIPIVPEVDPLKVEQAKAKIEEIPDQKLLEIELRGDYDLRIAEIQAQAEVLQASFEWQAKLDIAEVEAAAARLETLATSTATMFENTGDVLTELVGGLTGLSASEWLQVSKLIDDENKRRNQLLEAQLELLRTEVDLRQQQVNALQQGGAIIQIDSTGLEPELELVFRRILEKTQVWANQQGQSLLLGLS